MIEKAKEIVKNYVLQHLDKSDNIPEFDIYIVWQCKALQNWKFLISTSLLDGMYYELTFNGDKKEFYLDAYKKFENVCIREELPEFVRIEVDCYTPEKEINKIVAEQEAKGYDFLGIIHEQDKFRVNILKFRRK